MCSTVCFFHSRSTDPHIPAYPTIVEISNIHNHNIYNAAALRFRNVGPAAVEKLTKLFEAGHSPSSALDVLKYDLLVEYGDDYVYKSADRSICPDLGYCTRYVQFGDMTLSSNAHSLNHARFHTNFS